MSYEHRIVIVERHISEGKMPYTFAIELARFDLSWMKTGDAFKRIFTNLIDFDIFVNNEDPNAVYPDEYWRADMYGEHCKSATVDAVLDFIEQSGETNRRVKMLSACLTYLKYHADEYGDLHIVHYGY